MDDENTAERPIVVPETELVQVEAGQAVHYVHFGRHVPATIRAVHADGTVALQSDDNSLAVLSAVYSAGGAEATWHYPEV